MRNVRYFSLFIFIFVISANVVFAQKTKISAVFPTWEPYGYVENGKAAGFEIEIFSAVMERMNIEVEFLHQPWKRCLYSVENGLADVVISALKVEERTRFLYYPDEPISISKTALFTLTENNIVYEGYLEALKHYTIGVTSGFSYGPAFDACDFLKKDESTETGAVVSKVLLGRNELGAGNVAVIKMIAKKNNASGKIKFLRPLLHSQKLYVGFSKAKKHEKLCSDFSTALAEFRKSIDYKNIMKKYNLD